MTACWMLSVRSINTVYLHHTIRHYSANACLLPLCQLHGAAVTTVEGIGSTKTRIHPVQVRSERLSIMCWGSKGTSCSSVTSLFLMKCRINTDKKSRQLIWSWTQPTPSHHMNTVVLKLSSKKLPCRYGNNFKSLQALNQTPCFM